MSEILSVRSLNYLKSNYSTTLSILSIFEQKYLIKNFYDRIKKIRPIC